MARSPSRGSFSRLVRPYCAAGILVLFGAAGARAEYRINRGDVLAFTVHGAPELKEHTTVSLDGEVSIPLAGTIKAAGLPVSELLKQIKAIIPTKAYQIRTSDGRELYTAISADEISLTVAEYAPVYLTGDVAKPGQQTFRPGLSVRQAVSVAGGYDLARFRMSNPVIELPDLRSTYETLWLSFAREQARVWRLEAERDGKTSLEQADLSKVPVPAAVLSRIMASEADTLAVRVADLKKDRAHLEAGLARAAEHLDILRRQQEAEEQGSREDAADYERLKTLFDRGSAPISRVTDAKRAMLLSSPRELQTDAQIAQVQREQEDLRRSLQKLDDQRRLDLTGELQDARERLAQVTSRLQATGEKLLYTGRLRSQLTSAGRDTPAITIVRRTDDGPKRIEATEDAELQPGDAVEIALTSAVPAEAALR
jgi:polysaccharide export outer membrane protein